MDPQTAQIVSGWWVFQFETPHGEKQSISLTVDSVQIVFMLGSLLPTFALDRMGRRKTMIVGTFGLGFSMMMIAILLSFKDNQKTASASVAFFFLVSSIHYAMVMWALLIICPKYMLVFGMTINCAPWVYVPEILPLHARIRGSALAISSEWLWVSALNIFTSYFLN